MESSSKMIMAVLRPKDPEEAVKKAQKISDDRIAGLISEAESFGMMQALVSSQEHMFIGLLSSADQIVDLEGNAVDKVRPGDAILPYEQLIVSLETDSAERATREN